jgi:hypothetical protein
MEKIMTAFKPVAIGTVVAAFLIAGSAIAGGSAGHLQEQLSLSDGPPDQFNTAEQRSGPAGRPAESRSGGDDKFLRAQLSVSDGNPQGYSESGSGEGPQGRSADPSGGGGDPLLEHNLSISDGPPR